MQDEVKVSQWRKKPVVITAVQINTQQDAEECPGICTGGPSCKSKGAPDGAWPHIHTLEGDHTWTPGDWCITGVKGERYFCKPDIFEQTYEPATDQAERETLARMEPVAFQKGVDQWMDVCFGEAIKADKVERCDRFIEEALEFVQSVGYSAERAHALVDYVFNRDIGEVNQEVGGVMVTLAAACNTIGVDIASAAQTELARVWTKVDAIRAKQAAKPTGSALPIALPPAPEAGQ